MGKKILGGHDHFLGECHLTLKINITFLSKISCKMFLFYIIFLEKAVFSGETAKNCSGCALDHFFRERELLRQKVNITFLITN